MQTRCRAFWADRILSASARQGKKVKRSGSTQLLQRAVARTAEVAVKRRRPNRGFTLLPFGRHLRIKYSGRALKWVWAPSLPFELSRSKLVERTGVQGFTLLPTIRHARIKRSCSHILQTKTEAPEEAVYVRSLASIFATRRPFPVLQDSSV